MKARWLNARVTGSVRLVRRDLPQIAPCIPYRSAPVPVRQVERVFNRCGARVERASIGRVDVVDVDIKKRRHRFAEARFADHDHRVADANLRRAIALDVTSGVERLPQKPDQTSGTLNNEARRNRMPARGNTRGRRYFLHCFSVKEDAPVALGTQGCRFYKSMKGRRSGSWKNRTHRPLLASQTRKTPRESK